MKYLKTVVTIQRRETFDIVTLLRLYGSRYEKNSKTKLYGLCENNPSLLDNIIPTIAILQSLSRVYFQVTHKTFGKNF